MALQFIRHSIDASHNCYFDESEKDDFIAVAGFIATFESWIALESKWRKTLPAVAKGDFHYTDFWHSEKNYASKWSHSKRLEHIKELATIARKIGSLRSLD